MTKTIDTALECLYLSAKILGIPADRAQLQRAYVVGEGRMNKVQFIRAGRELGLKVGSFTPKNQKCFSTMAYPVVAIMKNTTFVILNGISDDGKALMVIDPLIEQGLPMAVVDFTNQWSGEFILLTRRFTEEIKEKKFGLSWFFPALWKYKRFMLQVLGISFLLQLVGLGAPFLMQVVIDNVLVHRSWGTLNSIAGALILIAFVQCWITWLRAYLFTNTINKVDVSLGDKLFRHVLALPQKFFESKHVGDVVARIEELNQIRQFITGAGLTVVLDIIFVLTYFVVMVNYSYSLTLITLGVIIVFAVFQISFVPFYKKFLQDKFNLATKNKSYLIETLTGIQTVKASAVENNIVRKWERMLAQYVNVSFRLVNLSNIAGNIGTVIQQCFVIGILFVGANLIIANKLTLGELIAFQMISAQVIEPMLRLINMWQSFQSAKVSVDRLGDILNVEKEPAFNPNRTTLPNLEGHIKFDRVTFRYKEDFPEVIKSLSFEIKAGMKVGLVGRSGSGKSTLTKLIQRIYVPESGRILIDGVDVAQVEPAWLRRQIGVVLQENFLFNGSISENVTIAKSGAEKEEVEKAAQIAGVDIFVDQMPENYDTSVGERGSALSGGQKQRVAIARALINDPRVVIFDEATSALDYETEKIVMQNIEKIAEGRTMFIIAHRLSTVRSCDLIMVVEKGQIVESGSHGELMNQKGFYYNQYIQQEGEFSQVS
ncbi:MAG TPA: type I secretion system permease/ATPase [Lentisphaeria bacterium]|nr:MAG: peptidase C39 [Lentisphaerae bacterium GWF2_38_69]HBM16904.1 type I secretion system permease/ATPase [Lentisphaeria bacterium]